MAKISEGIELACKRPLVYNFRQRALPLAVKDLPVVISEFGEEAPAVGAVGMALVAGEEVLEARCREMQTE